MPRSPARLCNGCGSIVRGRCPNCGVGWTTRPTKRKVSTGDRRWRRLRAQVLAEEPICRACRVAPSVEADHIRPVTHGGAELDRSNVQGLCKPCHKDKTHRESMQGR